MRRDDLHQCSLSTEDAYGVVTEDEFDDMQFLGCKARSRHDLSVFKFAKIMGKHFAEDEWDKKGRIGSVITCVMNGRSLYGRVLKFIRFEGESCPGYASVRWFSAPTYVNCLCPHVRLDGASVAQELDVQMVRITQIDPSQLAVEIFPGNEYHMIRDSGYDTR